MVGADEAYNAEMDRQLLSQQQRVESVATRSVALTATVGVVATLMEDRISGPGADWASALLLIASVLWGAFVLIGRPLKPGPQAATVTSWFAASPGVLAELLAHAKSGSILMNEEHIHRYYVRLWIQVGIAVAFVARVLSA